MGLWFYRISILIRRYQRGSERKKRNIRELSFSAQRDDKNTARRQLHTSQEKRPQKEIYIIGTLILDFPASKTVIK